MLPVCLIFQRVRLERTETELKCNTGIRKTIYFSIIIYGQLVLLVVIYPRLYKVSRSYLLFWLEKLTVACWQQ